MNCLDMSRRPKNFLLDERILDALDLAAKNAGYKSANKFVEATLFSLMKMSGNLPKDAEPLPESRGGRGKKKADPSMGESAGQPIDIQPKKTQDSTTNNTNVNTDDDVIVDR
jgi:hypothetical protein